MANEFKIKNGLFVDQGGANITGSVSVSGSISAISFTGSFLGSASYALTASYALNGGGSSTPGGFSTNVQYNNGGVFAGSNRFTFNGSTVSITGGGILNATGSLQGTASWAENSISASYAASITPGGSNQNVQFNNNGVLGGSNAFSYDPGTKTVSISNSGVLLATGSLFGSASYALTASYALNGGGGGAPGGSDTEFQYNNSGVFAGTVGINYTANRGLQHGNAQATGLYSYAQGTVVTASGDYSHAEGTNTKAIGDYSHAEGNTTQTGTQTGYSASFANGTGSLDSIYGDLTGTFPATNLLYLNDVDYDYAFGVATFIIGGSYFNGTNTEIYISNTNPTTKAIVGNIAAGPINWTGDQTLGSVNAHAEGNNTIALSQDSHAEGNSNAAIGFYSHAEGANNQAIGESSHAEGGSNRSIGSYSHTEGDSNVAIGYTSHAEGVGNIAGTYGYSGVSTTTSGIITLDALFGDVSAQFITTHIVFDDQNQTYYLELDPLNPPYFNGTNTILTLVDTTFSPPKTAVAIPGIPYPPFADYILGNYSHAEGNATQTYGNSSHAEGTGNIAIATNQHVIGTYNLQTNGALFVIGNGDNTTRSNLLIASGSEVQITGSLNVTGGITASLNGSSSYASTASYVNGNITKANIAAVGVFSGTPLTASITFATAFPNTNYSVTITGEDARIFTIQNKLAGGFEINTNSNVALTGDTHWHAINYGEFNS